MYKFLLTNIGTLSTPTGEKAKCGKQQGDITQLHDAAVALNFDDSIGWVGSAKDAPEAMDTLDCGGALVTPALVDCHTHLMFGGWRQHELMQKNAGRSYLEILESGGGILSTMRATRATSFNDLCARARGFLDEMFLRGVAVCEIKSGYGLSFDEEMRLLLAMATLVDHPIKVVPTFMGAHALPPEYSNNRAGYFQMLREKLLPEVSKDREQSGYYSALASYCDAFCEPGVFSVEESRAHLLAAREFGLQLKIHADELSPSGGAELAAELGAVSAEHLIRASQAGMEAMAKSGVIGVLLPLTSLFLGQPFADARAMLDAGMAVAVASDFNPGSSPCGNLQLAMNLAATQYKMSAAEALTAVTLNAAAAVGQAEPFGSIEVGKYGHLLVWDAPDLDYIFYRMGNNLIKHIVVGKEVYQPCQKS